MSWRTVQLGDQLCDQDRLLMDLFDNVSVNYIGFDHEFKQQLMHDPDSNNLVLILNSPIWVSDIVASCQKYLINSVETFYIGINRYLVLGNDTTMLVENTTNRGSDLIHVITEIAKTQKFSVTKSGHFDQDRGRYFNFIQPLTWVYGHKITN